MENESHAGLACPQIDLPLSMTPEPQQLLKEGSLRAALEALKRHVAANPGDPASRWFLFQLFCFSGEWKRASDQLRVAAKLDKEYESFALIFNRVIAAERLRPEIVEGVRTPLFLGEPEGWVAGILEANRLLGLGETAAATSARESAFESMPALNGRINGEAFEWIADQDTRFGAQLECFLHGKYYWLPFSQIKELTVEAAPKTHTDILYPKAQVALSNGGVLDVLLFARYPFADAPEDERLCLNRLTVWDEINEYTVCGKGQRVFCTDGGDYSLLELRTLEIGPCPT